jgi:alpha-N-arabinofuranosidase
MSKKASLLTRRGFSAGMAGMMIANGAPTTCRAAAAGSANATIEISLGESNGIIPRENFGCLLEVIGSSIYDGVWVGEKSNIPNVGGIRKELIDGIRLIGTGVIRWPGGCFSSNYDWRDGIGPQKDRPTRTSFWNDKLPREVPIGPQRFDPNHFGTDELVRLCKLTGAQPFLNANTRSLGAQVFDRWVEYCNSPAGSTSLSKQRAVNGSIEPFGVKYWGVGNEPWGYDGQLTATEYLTIYKEFASMLPVYGARPELVAACGPNSNLEWVSTILEGTKNYKNIAPIFPSLMSIHHYPGTDRTTNFDEQDWYEFLAGASWLDQVIEETWAVMASADPNHDTKIAVDEWGAVLAKGTEVSAENYWSRAVTLRDVVHAGLTLDILNRQSDKVKLACFTGLINQEGGIFIAEGKNFVPTGVYHVFELYKPHQGGQLIPTHFDAPTVNINYTGPVTSIVGKSFKSLWGLNGSASLKGKTLTLTVVNPHLHEHRETTVKLISAKATSVVLTSISNDDIHAQNTFERPNILVPVRQLLDASGASFVATLSPASVNRLTVQLA